MATKLTVTERFIHETVDSILGNGVNPRNASAVLGYLSARHAENMAKLRIDYMSDKLRLAMKDSGIDTATMNILD